MENKTTKQDKTSLKKVNNNLLVDVETVNDQRIIMELSCLVVNSKLAITEQHCYIIQQVWENEEYRNGKYAKEKLAHWQEMLDNGTAELISIYHLYNKLNKLIKTKKITLFSAYNVGFDYKAIENTYHRYGIDKRPNYKEENQLYTLEKFCLWNYAKKHYCSKDYVLWALRNKKFTPTLKLRTNAETLYQYLTEKYNFIETHFGIEDLQIEYTIFITSVIQNTLDRNNALELNRNGNWQTIESYKKELEEKGWI